MRPLTCDPTAPSSRHIKVTARNKAFFHSVLSHVLQARQPRSKDWISHRGRDVSSLQGIQNGYGAPSPPQLPSQWVLIIIFLFSNGSGLWPTHTQPTMQWPKWVNSHRNRGWEKRLNSQSLSWESMELHSHFPIHFGNTWSISKHDIHINLVHLLQVMHTVETYFKQKHIVCTFENTIFDEMHCHSKSCMRYCGEHASLLQPWLAGLWNWCCSAISCGQQQGRLKLF